MDYKLGRRQVDGWLLQLCFLSVSSSFGKEREKEGNKNLKSCRAFFYLGFLQFGIEWMWEFGI